MSYTCAFKKKAPRNRRVNTHIPQYKRDFSIYTSINMNVFIWIFLFEITDFSKVFWIKHTTTLTWNSCHKEHKIKRRVFIKGSYWSWSNQRQSYFTFNICWNF